MRFRCIAGKLILTLGIAFQLVLQSGAQTIRPDSLKDPSVKPAPVKVLHSRLEQNTNRLDPVLTDSLLQATRQLDDPAGRVVALCQAAVYQGQNGQSMAAEALRQEAIGRASGLRDRRELRWAMGQIGSLMSRSNSTQLAPVLAAIGDAMKQTIGRGKPAGSEGERLLRWNDNRAAMSPMAPPTNPPDFVRFGRGTPPVPHHVTERWLDSLVRAGGQTSPEVNQLVEKRKRRDSSGQLSQTFAQRGDYVKAYNYYVQYTAYKDSLAAEVTARQVAALQYKQASQKKEAQIRLLTAERQLREQEVGQQQQWVLALVGLAVLLLGFSFTLIRSNRLRQQANSQLIDQKQALEETLTELKTTQNQLIQSEKMAALGELTAGIAHEIQNPLNFVNNFSEVSTELVEELSEELNQSTQRNELQGELLNDLKLNLQKITQHGERASSIVKGMLEHSRSIGGEKGPADLNRLAEEQLKLAYHTLQTKDPTFRANLTTQFTPELGPVNVVRQEIGRVLLNLYQNALYALQQKLKSHPVGYMPEVRVATKTTGQQVVLTIWDNGIGIPASIQSKVFQPFFTTKPTGVGTGLGLSLCYEIITKGYGGSVHFVSQEGEFTEFTLTLPMVIK